MTDAETSGGSESTDRPPNLDAGPARAGLDQFIASVELDDAGLTACPVDAVELLRAPMSELGDPNIREVVTSGTLRSGFASDSGPPGISCALTLGGSTAAAALVLAPVDRGQTVAQWMAAFPGEEVNDVTERGTFAGGQFYAVRTTMADGGRRVARSAIWADDHLLVMVGAVSPDDGTLDVDAAALKQVVTDVLPQVIDQLG